MRPTGDNGAGRAEAVLAEGKTPEQVVDIVRALVERGRKAVWAKAWAAAHRALT